MCAQTTYYGEICVDTRRRGSDLAPVRLDGYSLEECWTALSRLSRSCQELREIAQPILYHSIFVSRKRLPLLVRTLTASPNLALNIVDLYIHGEKDTNFFDAGVAEKATLTSILIQKAVKLRRLHLGFEEPAFFSALFQSIASWLTSESGQGYRQQLEYISLDPEIKHWIPRYSDRHDQGRMIDGNKASPLFRLAGSGLKTLRCRSPIYPTLTSGLNLGNIVELSLCQNWAEAGAPNGLDQCVLTLPRLRNLLGAVGLGLQRFSISRHLTNRSGPRLHPDHRLVELQDVLAELLPWKDTLRELVFEGDLAELRRTDEVIVRSGVGDLAQFHNLEVLAIRGREYFDFLTQRHGGGGPVLVSDFIAALGPRLQHLRISGVDVSTIYLVLRAISDDVHQNARNNRRFPCLRLVQVDAGIEKYLNSQYRLYSDSNMSIPMAFLGEISRLGRGLSPCGVAFDRWEDLGWRDEWLAGRH